jgi:hypothetical protein
MATTVSRRITFSAWADANPKAPFDVDAALSEVKPLEGEAVILEQSEALTAAVVLQSQSGMDPALIQLLALRDFENRPINWGPGSLPEPITIGEDEYTADITHVAIWPDKITAHDVYSNAPGLTRLSAYFRDKAQQRVIFRPLYDPDLADLLKDIEGFRRVEYGIHTPSKVQQAKSSNFLGDLFPAAFGKKVPSIRVSLGMSRKSPRDAYIDDSVSDAVLTTIEHAEQFLRHAAHRGQEQDAEDPDGQPEDGDDQPPQAADPDPERDRTGSKGRQPARRRRGL